MMNRRHIAVKVFIAVLVPLMILAGIFLFLQARYFSSFYTAQKEQSFREASEQAAMYLDGKELPEDDLISIMRQSEIDSGVMLALFIPQGETGGKIDFDVITCGSYLPPEMLSLVWDMAVSGGDNLTAGPQTVHDQGDEYLAGTHSVIVNDETCVLGIGLSLQPVDEAVDVLSAISWLVYAVMALFSIVITLVLSLFVSRPLIKELEKENQ